MRVSGMAAQLTATKGRDLRGLRSWRVRATSSLPVPLSPVMRTETLEGAMRSMRERISRMDGEVADEAAEDAGFAEAAAGDFKLDFGFALAGGVGEDGAQAGGVDGLLQKS
jgi:hypothetical protein